MSTTEGKKRSTHGKTDETLAYYGYLAHTSSRADILVRAAAGRLSKHNLPAQHQLFDDWRSLTQI